MDYVIFFRRIRSVAALAMLAALVTGNVTAQKWSLVAWAIAFVAGHHAMERVLLRAWDEATADGSDDRPR